MRLGAWLTIGWSQDPATRQQGPLSRPDPLSRPSPSRPGLQSNRRPSRIGRFLAPLNRGGFSGGRAQLSGTARPRGRGKGDPSLGLRRTPCASNDTPASRASILFWVDGWRAWGWSPEREELVRLLRLYGASLPCCSVLRPGAYLKIGRGARTCPPRRGSGRPESPVQRAFPRSPHGSGGRHDGRASLRVSWPDSVLLVMRCPLPSTSSSSSHSHSREGLGVPWPDLFDCFCVSGWRVPPWLGSHVYTCPFLGLKLTRLF
jgi:hypothetical protein